MEEIYQKALEVHLCGTHCKLKHGITDISNDRLHAEIKCIESWKGALGQLLYYNFISPKDELHMYLFGKKPKKFNINDIANFLKTYDITLFYHCLSLFEIPVTVVYMK
jgi:hypothetical protein